MLYWTHNVWSLGVEPLSGKQRTRWDPLVSQAESIYGFESDESWKGSGTHPVISKNNIAATDETYEENVDSNCQNLSHKTSAPRAFG